VRSAALAAALAVGCAGCCHRLRGADPAVGVDLPRDHAGHADAQTEWWHYHGHLVDDAGRRYDFFLGFIRQHTDYDRILLLPVRWFVDPFHVAYFAVTDRAAGKFHVREKHSYPDVWAAGVSNRRLAMHHDSWRAAARPDGSIALSARTDRERMELVLRAAKPPALLGRRGYLHVPPRSSHYYYSLPRMTAEGTLTVGGERRAVRGAGWLKHEWGFLYTDHLAGWVWFGVQLSTGQELEIGLIFDRRWNLAEGAFAVVEERDGAVTPIPVRALGVKESGDTWRSPRTGTVYPTGWVLEVPGRGTLVLEAAVAGQEMVVFPANLWAGAMTVEGVFDGEPVTGDCFTEVVGLDTPFGRSLFASGRPAGGKTRAAPRRER
jgi:predicted secreted hydrolase